MSSGMADVLKVVLRYDWDLATFHVMMSLVANALPLEVQSVRSWQQFS
jgi:hypothetical protein